MANFDNQSDVIDSRDIIARIEELTDERDTLTDEIEALTEEADELFDLIGEAGDANAYREAVARHDDAVKALTAWNDENSAELAALESLASECECYGDWQYGESLIRHDYFTQYIEQLVHDSYEFPELTGWPFSHLTMDWTACAEEAEQDYTHVDFDGVTYLMRA